MNHLREQIQSLGNQVKKDAEDIKLKHDLQLQEKLTAYMSNFNPVPTPLDDYYDAFIAGVTAIVLEWNKNKPWII